MSKIARTREQWQGMKPEAVCAGSPAQILFCVQDAQHDILELLREVDCLLAELGHLDRRTEADLVWDDSDAEYSCTDIIDIVDNYADGEVVRVRRAVCLADVFAVRIGDNMREFGTATEAEAWAAAELAHE